jgi:two-component system, cell cycle sensor histidine kinase and response regulator CckA
MSVAAKFSWTPRDSGAELRLMFENAPMGLAQCQPQGAITALNPVLEQMLGDIPATGRSLSFGDLIDPADQPSGERLMREMFDGKRDSFQLDSKSLAAKGQAMRWTAWRVSGVDGKQDYALALAEQVHEDPDAQRRLRQAQRLETVGRLAGGVAHDFNNLLTGVLLYCDLLVAGLEPGHRARKYAEEIRSAGLQATGLVRQLLAVSRPSGCEPRLLSLNEIAEGIRSLLVRLIGENIELKFRLDPNLGLIRMDHTQAQQILLNLVLNARDAMPGGGQITVDTSNCQVQVLTDPGSGASSPASLPCALFVVGDNGCGMDAATQGHLFEAFFTTKSGKGTGLGLATVHDIVTGNGGLIYVDSVPARGTRVSVLLPLVHETAPDFHPRSETLPERQEGALLPLKKE